MKCYIREKRKIIFNLFYQTGLIQYEEVMTSLAEIVANSTEEVKNSESSKEVQAKVTNAETGVAGKN